MKCPHCAVAIHPDFKDVQIASFGQLKYNNVITNHPMTWVASVQRCPACIEDIIFLKRPIASIGTTPTLLAYPRSSTRPIPDSVPDPYRSDFREACLVLRLSPKASAALSRRTLQAILREAAGAKEHNLYDQIETVIASGKVPSHITDALHAVREIGNFAAHTMKSTNSGEILDVEEGEADWNLDVLESLFDFYFVGKEKLAKHKLAINAKLKEAGRKELS